MNTENIIKIIEAVGKQWPFLVTVFVIIVVIIKWKTIWKAIGNLSINSIKSGNTVLQFSTSKENSTNSIPEKTVASETAEKTTLIENKESSIIDCFFLLKKGETKKAQETFDIVLKETVLEKRFELELQFIYYKFLNGIKGSIDEINKMLTKDNLGPNDKYYVYFYLGLCLQNSTQTERTIQTFNKAIELTNDESNITYCKICISETLLKAKNYYDAIEVLKEQLKNVELDKSKVSLYRNLSSIYEELKDTILQIAYLEKAVDISTNDVSLLFDLAYLYSQSDFDEPSIYHYKNLLRYNANHSMALNNIGVGLRENKLPFKSVSYLLKSIEKDNSLAAGNLAKSFIGIGCEKEALELINKFKDTKDVNQLLIDAHTQLIAAKRNEVTNFEEITKAGQNISTFFINYSLSLLNLNTDLNYKNNEWLDEEGNEVTVIFNESNIEISWEKENNIFSDKDKHIITGKFNINGLKITYSCPKTVHPSVFSNTPSKPFKSIEKYEGFCSLNLEKNSIILMYKVNKSYDFKNLTKPSA